MKIVYHPVAEDEFLDAVHCGFWLSTITAVTRVVGSTGSANDVRHYLVVARSWAPSGPPRPRRNHVRAMVVGRNFDVPSYVPLDLATARGLPVPTGLAATPETSRHTSIHQRVKHAVAQRRLEDLKAPACAVLRATAPQGRWKRICGCASSKADAERVCSARVCSRRSRWAVICYWSTEPAGCAARAKPIDNIAALMA
jgi:hypothetical protein